MNDGPSEAGDAEKMLAHDGAGYALPRDKDEKPRVCPKCKTPNLRQAEAV